MEIRPMQRYCSGKRSKLAAKPRLTESPPWHLIANGDNDAGTTGDQRFSTPLQRARGDGGYGLLVSSDVGQHPNRQGLCFTVRVTGWYKANVANEDDSKETRNRLYEHRKYDDATPIDVVHIMSTDAIRICGG